MPTAVHLAFSMKIYCVYLTWNECDTQYLSYMLRSETVPKSSEILTQCSTHIFQRDRKLPCVIVLSEITMFPDSHSIKCPLIAILAKQVDDNLSISQTEDILSVCREYKEMENKGRDLTKISIWSCSHLALVALSFYTLLYFWFYTALVPPTHHLWFHNSCMAVFNQCSILCLECSLLSY